MKREIFKEITATPLKDALDLWLRKINSLGNPCKTEDIKVADSVGRLTAEAVIARLSSPSYHSAAMDGYAVRFAETFGATEKNPKKLRIGSDAIYIDTGEPMPEGFDAVIMIEDVHVEDGFIEIISPATPWQNVRIIGEDIVAGELILPENHRIRPVDVGAMLGSGILSVKVRQRPRVAIIPTGNEIIEPESVEKHGLRRGQIIEYNSRVLAGLASEWGAEVIRFDIVPDNLDLLKSAIKNASSVADLVIVNAGASTGTEDYTASAISALGEVLVHGLNIKPGKPAILGLVGEKPVIGAPGYPVSAYIVFELFAKPVICLWQSGVMPDEVETLRAKLSRQIASPLGQEEFIRVKVGKVGDNFIATPLGRGAGLMMSLVRADGMLRIPANSEGRAQGAEVEISLIRTRKEIENTIVSVGSHDNVLDLLSNCLKKRYPFVNLSSAHVGSMGGLMALKRKEAHIAPTHLLDEAIGEYNVPFIEKLLPKRKIVLLNLLYRTQGLIVKKGNPKNIKDVTDLIRNDVRFINRQKGSGTRLLFDKYLRDNGIGPASIMGYEHEEYTHMAVASAVLTGIADAGMGVLSAANALGLDFIPLAKERYDLAIDGEFFHTEMIQALVDVIRNDDEFRQGVSAMGGYDSTDMGKIMWET